PGRASPPGPLPAWPAPRSLPRRRPYPLTPCRGPSANRPLFSRHHEIYHGTVEVRHGAEIGGVAENDRSQILLRGIGPVEVIVDHVVTPLGGQILEHSLQI